MKKIKVIIAIIFLITSSLVNASEIDVSSRAGYSPASGGSMSSGWQSGTLKVSDGINDINRSKDGFAVSSIEAPVGVIAGADFRIIQESVYCRAGIEYVYQISGGKGKTLDYSGTELVEVTYTQWSFDVPLTMGITFLFWGESRIYIGGGLAFAYGNYSNIFKSATIDYTASFTGYGIPVVAEIGCEYLLNEKVSLGCDLKYLYGRSQIIKADSDFARVDFSGYHLTASANFRINI